MASYASASPEARKFLAFGSHMETAKKEREVRGPLMKHNNKAWRAAISTADFSLRDVSLEPPIIHELSATGSSDVDEHDFKDVIQLNGLLDADECEKLIQAANSVGFMGSNDLPSLNLAEYSDPNKIGKNSAEVLLVEDEALAAVLWDRMKEVVLEKVPTSTLQTHFFGAFILRAFAVCPLMRILRYEEGQQFKPHADGVDYDVAGPSGEVCRSRLTVALYLNKSDTEEEATPTTTDSRDGDAPSTSLPCGAGSYRGGAFRFLLPPKLVPHAVAARLPHCTIATSVTNSPLIPVYPHYPNGGKEVSPDVGRAILFGQDEYHEGLPVLGGSKYMIQTSVLYELVPETKTKPFTTTPSSLKSDLSLSASISSIVNEKDESNEKD